LQKVKSVLRLVRRDERWLIWDVVLDGPSATWMVNGWKGTARWTARIFSTVIGAPADGCLGSRLSMPEG